MLALALSFFSHALIAVTILSVVNCVHMHFVKKIFDVYARNGTPSFEPPRLPDARSIFLSRSRT